MTFNLGRWSLTFGFQHLSLEEAEAEERIAKLGFVATEKKLKKLEGIEWLAEDWSTVKHDGCCDER